MDKRIKKFLDDEYFDMYQKLNISWKLGVKKEKSILKSKGLSNSGFEQSILCDFAINLIKSNVNKFKEFIKNNQDKFNIVLPDKLIEEYTNESIDNSIKYLEMFEKELLEYFAESQISLIESCKSKFNNAKLSVKIDLTKIKEEMLLINNSRNNEYKNNKRFNKKDIISYILALLGIIVTIFLTFF